MLITVSTLLCILLPLHLSINTYAHTYYIHIFSQNASLKGQEIENMREITMMSVDIIYLIGTSKEDNRIEKK